jgi:hypothetical protein
MYDAAEGEPIAREKDVLMLRKSWVRKPYKGLFFLK